MLFKTFLFNDAHVVGLQVTMTGRRRELAAIGDSTLYHDPLPDSFALCLEWINGIYNTPDTDCLECYRPHPSVDTTTPKIDRKHMHSRHMSEIRTRYMS